MRACLPCIFLLFLSACAAYPAASPPPAQALDTPPVHALDDPALAHFLSARAGMANGPERRWNVDTLTLAALYFGGGLRAGRHLSGSEESDAWNTRRRIRSAFLAYYAALREADILARESTSRGERKGARSDAAEKTAALTRLQDSRNALAALVRISVRELYPARLNFHALEHPPALSDVPPSLLQSAALLQRPELRQALADYAHDARSVIPSPGASDGIAVPAYYWNGERWVLAAPLPNAASPDWARLHGDAAALDALQERMADDVGYRWRRYRERLASFDATCALPAAERNSLAVQRNCLTALVQAQQALGDLEDAIRAPLTGRHLQTLLARTGLESKMHRQARAPFRQVRFPSTQSTAATGRHHRVTPRSAPVERRRVYLLRNAAPYPPSTWE